MEEKERHQRQRIRQAAASVRQYRGVAVGVRVKTTAVARAAEHYRSGGGDLQRGISERLSHPTQSAARCAEAVADSDMNLAQCTRSLCNPDTTRHNNNSTAPWLYAPRATAKITQGGEQAQGEH